MKVTNEQGDVVIHMTRREADDLIASLRHVGSGGNITHNEATPAVQFTAELLINSYTAQVDK